MRKRNLQRDRVSHEMLMLRLAELETLMLRFIRIMLDPAEIRYKERLVDAIEGMMPRKRGRPSRAKIEAISPLPVPQGEAVPPAASPPVEEIPEDPLKKYTWLQLSQEEERQ